jgi:hypothetical protein
MWTTYFCLRGGFIWPSEGSAPVSHNWRSDNINFIICTISVKRRVSQYMHLDCFKKYGYFFSLYSQLTCTLRYHTLCDCTSGAYTMCAINMCCKRVATFCPVWATTTGSCICSSGNWNAWLLSRISSFLCGRAERAKRWENAWNTLVEKTMCRKIGCELILDCVFICFL